MRLEHRQGSRNVEDRRGQRGGGMRMGLPVGGIGGILLILLLSFITGRNPLELLGGMGGLGGGGVGFEEPSTGPAPGSVPADDEASIFLRKVLASTEDAWTRVFAQAREQYDPPVLVLFSDATQSGCGVGQSAMGPFYCPADRKVYLDLSFFRDLAQRFGAPGDFAQAYVVAHEVGHHIQTLTGLSDKVGAARQRSGQAEGNQLSVRQELQADCYAGVWGSFAAKSGELVAGDVEEGLRAAAAIGDDRLQRQTQGRVAPESFTHGSSEQRVEWFRRGLESGSVDSCDTFAR
jgi:predicted metalloprotease